MILKEHVHPDKLRGGFYTEPHVVDFCLSRIRAMRGEWSGRWLEPSAGAGAFLRGLVRAVPARQRQRIELTAIELMPAESAKCEAALDEGSISGRVINGSFFDWATSGIEDFDVVVGNPPFVRYQFVSEQDRSLAEALVAELGISLRRVSNLWIPFALVALNRIRVGGCFSLVLPSELFCTASGGQFRQYLVRRFTDLSIDLFPRGTFPDILQDVVVVSGRRAVRPAEARPVQFSEHRRDIEVRWLHRVAVSGDPWLRYMLTEREHDAYIAACALDGFYALGQLARIEVAIVTGANSFFTITDETADEYDLWDWTIPLLARTADSPGVVFTNADHEAARTHGSRAWLLDFSKDRPTPNGRQRVSDYLALGEAQGLPTRYKCRIRKPWYRVPHIQRGDLMMTKRAHHYHRLLLNQAQAYTTDTIYRGRMRDLYRGREHDLAAAFQNTLTLLSSEIEGRTYGGGVLELVPSEVARLTVPLLKTNGLIDEVDTISRGVNGQLDPTHAVMQTTDEFLSNRYPAYAELLPLLDAARRRLQSKRQEATD
ncbi:MAG: SAM-dependent methyltransferase [Planctomycetes bacterium]|nr:SAM-dependent methyltransferase [Planctomycetota bacterium]